MNFYNIFYTSLSLLPLACIVNYQILKWGGACCGGATLFLHTKLLEHTNGMLLGL